jgi:pimeloyl-ACP methyl ester carboxylesterase
MNLAVGGRDIAVHCWGDPELQPLALCVHGWSGNSSHFAAFVPALRRAGYAVVAFDQPAHGASDGRTATLAQFAQTLAAVARRFRGERPVEALLAHSLGGAAAAYAMARGLLVQRAVMIAPIADPVAASRRFARAVWLPECLRARMQSLLEQRTRVAFDAFRARRAVRALGMPGLVIHDLHDREVPWHEGHEYAHYWPQARLLSTHGLGHAKLLREPTVIAAAVDFLAGRVVGEAMVGTFNLAPLF